MQKKNLKEGFTLIELLIVLTILSILSITSILVLNPAEILRKARDTQRIADLNSLKLTIALYLTTTDEPSLEKIANTLCTGGTGTDSIWYSLPTDLALPNGGKITDTTLANDSFPQKTSVAIQTTLQNTGLTNGNGWIPINLEGTTGGSPLSNFPIDPNHNVANPGKITNNDLTYRYACSSNKASKKPLTFEIDARMESIFYTTAPNDIARSDGGNNPLLYEVGTNLTLLPDDTPGDF